PRDWSSDVCSSDLPTPAQRVRLKVATVTEEITVSARSADPTAPDQNSTAVDLDHDLLRSLPAKNDNPLAVASLFVDPAANGAEGTKIDCSAILIGSRGVRRSDRK